MDLDELDKRILALLQENGKTGYREMAKTLGTNPSTVFNRVRTLENQRVIKKYSAILDPESLGYDLTAIIFIRANGPHIIDIEKELASMSEVMMVYDITGDYDILVMGKFKNRDELNKFVKKVLAMPNIERTLTNLVLNVIKEDLSLRVERMPPMADPGQ